MEPSDPRVRIAVLVGALKLEVLGMTRRGRSVYAIVKDEFGLRGNKRRVLEQLQDIKERLNEPYPEPPQFEVNPTTPSLIQRELDAEAQGLRPDIDADPPDEYNRVKEEL